MTILLVDRCKDDMLFFRRSLTQVGFTGQVHDKSSAKEAAKYLKTCRQNTPERLPGVLVVDLGLPSGDAIALLRWLKREPLVCFIPVVVLTDTPYAADIDRAYQLGAKTFFEKPALGPELERVARQVIEIAAAPKHVEQSSSVDADHISIGAYRELFDGT